MDDVCMGQRASAPVAIVLGAFAAVLAVVLGAVCLGMAASGTGDCGAGSVGAVRGAPQRLVPIYERASARYELGSRGAAILASINEVETDFGRLNTVSSAGAEGWMQFMPETWAAYGVDANGDGRRDPYDPEDAIFAAANYLKASGAPGDWRQAIFAYNHADWYVEGVLRGARRFAAGGGSTASVSPCNAAPAGPAVQKMVAEAERLDALHLTYVYGGSHGRSPTAADGPFDCSSAVSHLLQVAGFGNPTMDTTVLIGWGEPGPGRWVSIHVKPYGPDAHTFIEFDASVTPDSKRYWGTSGTNPGGGPGWIPESAFSATYLAGFQLRHPPGP